MGFHLWSNQTRTGIIADWGQGQEALNAVQASLGRPLVGVPPGLGSYLCAAVLLSRMRHTPGPHDVYAAATLRKRQKSGCTDS